MIEVQGLTKRFGERLAIEGVSFEVQDGEILGFLGPNGAGKTTTMRILTGYMPPSEGTARLEGFDVLENPGEVKRRVGYLPETPPLYTELLVSEYLHYVASLKGVTSGGRAAAVDRVVGRCGLSDVRNRLIANLSKGYRQRVGLAQALIHDPRVVILDEPTSGLDPNQIHEVRNLIRETARDRTVILSTHILSEVEALCDKVAIINEGRIVAVDKPEALSARERGAGTRLRLRVARAPNGGADVKAALAGVSGVSGVEQVAPEDGCHFEIHAGSDPVIREHIAARAVEKGYGLLELREEGARLEDVFLRLTREHPAGKPSAPVTSEGGESK